MYLIRACIFDSLDFNVVIPFKVLLNQNILEKGGICIGESTWGKHPDMFEKLLTGAYSMNSNKYNKLRRAKI